MKAEPGHLKEHDLNLPQTKQVRDALSKRQIERYALARLKAPALGWKREVR